MDLQSNNLVIPRGVMLFAKFLPGTMIPGPYRQFGNCPEFTLTSEVETLVHNSSQHGRRIKDAEIIIDAALSGTVTTDDINTENIERWFMGETSLLTTTAQTGSTLVVESAKVNDIHQLGETAQNDGGVRNVSNVVVTLTGTPATKLKLGVDYTVDEELGIFTYLEEQTASTTITFDVAASTREVTISTDIQIEGEMKFVAMNPDGPRRDIIIPRVRLAPNGDFQLVNDPDSPAFQQMPLTISALQRGTKPLAIVEGRPFTI